MNPFENQKGVFFVLVNVEGQHSLWPTFVDIPDGWQKIFGPASRTACLEKIETSWTDMRETSLVRSMN